MILKKIFTICVFALLTFSCAAKKDQVKLDYANDNGPELDFKELMNGNLEGSGIRQNSKGIVVDRFSIIVKADWEGDKAVIKRSFTFSDGEKDSRTWLVTKRGNKLSAVGHEVIGNARGQQYKSVANVVYKIPMTIDSQEQDITVSEMVYNIDDKSAIIILGLKSGRSKKGQIIMNLKQVSGKAKRIKKEVKIKPLSQATEKQEEDEVKTPAKSTQ